MGYRELRLVVPPLPVRLPHAAIGAWWAAFWIGNLFANFALRGDTSTLAGVAMRNEMIVISDAIDIVGAALAVVMVRGLSARLLERFRRVRHSTPDALQAAGVVIG